jgi:hypothetical protein
LLPPDDETKSQDAEESKSEAMMKVDNVAIAVSIPTSLPIAASIPTAASKSTELHYFTTGVHCWCLFIIFPGVQNHRSLLSSRRRGKKSRRCG